MTKEYECREYVLPVPPIANHRLMFAGGTKRRLILSPDARNYLKEVQTMLLTDRRPPMRGELWVEIVWVRSSRQIIGGSDIDSRVKCLLDSLEGKAYVNDNQISRLVVRRVDDDQAHPRVKVMVQEAPRD